MEENGLDREAAVAVEKGCGGAKMESRIDLCAVVESGRAGLVICGQLDSEGYLKEGTIGVDNENGYMVRCKDGCGR